MLWDAPPARTLMKNVGLQMLLLVFRTLCYLLIFLTKDVRTSLAAGFVHYGACHLHPLTCQPIVCPPAILLQVSLLSCCPLPVCLSAVCRPASYLPTTCLYAVISLLLVFLHLPVFAGLESACPPKTCHPAAPCLSACGLCVCLS
jgi:hypothetical protein